jgi:tetratricopeptide (TPR) repeat protein
LKVTLLGAAPKARATDPKAYALYLQARQNFWQYNPASLQRAVAACREALAIDPTYAPAWIALAMAYWAQIDLSLLPVGQGTDLAEAAIAKALEHDPAYGPAYAAMATFEGILQRDYASAAKHLERAQELDPTNVDVVNTASSLARRLGKLDLAIALARYQVSRDPVNVDGYDALALSYRYKGELDQSIATYRTLLGLQPDSGWEHTGLGRVLLQKGEKEAALAEFQQEPVEYHRLVGLAMGYHALGRKVESDAALAEVLQKYGDARPFHIAAAAAYRGDIDGAFRLIERAVQLGDIDIGALPVLSEFEPLRRDPRWEPLLRRLGLAADQLAAIPFDFKVPG